jgi:hypothetical protein
MNVTTKRDLEKPETRSKPQLPGLLTGERRAPTSARPPRTRSWGLVTLAALLVLGTGLAVAAFVLRAGEKESVVAVGVPIAKGQVIEREDLISVSVAGVAETIAVDEIDTVVGATATVDLLSGQILASAMITSSPVPRTGESVIGLALDPTRVPGAGLGPGDVVDVVAVPGGGTGKGGRASLDAPEVLAAGAAVFAVGGESTAGGQVLVTVVVAAEDAPRIAAYSTQNRIAVVEAAPAEVASDETVEE